MCNRQHFGFSELQQLGYAAMTDEGELLQLDRAVTVCCDSFAVNVEQQK